jgi:predicted nicotinamide N-methyase
MNPESLFMPETPLEALGPTIREQVFLEDRTFFLTRPSESDQLLDHPAVRAKFGADQYMPYWAELWPAARMLGKWILKQQWPSGLRALEIGCGLGLPGIVALTKGVHVTFSDYDATAIKFASDNARLNGVKNFDTLQMDWHYPPEGVTFPVILAADLIYELRNVEPLVMSIKKLLDERGVCLLTDQDRIPSKNLREMLAEQQLTFTTQMLRAGEPGGRRVKGTLYRIAQRGGSDPLGG